MIPAPGGGGGAGVKSYVETGAKPPAQATTTPAGGSASASAADTILTVCGEIIGVGLLSLVAGVSPDAGNAAIAFMLALWLIYMVTTGSSVLGGIDSKFSSAAAAVS